jgi:hypothetical protein
VTRHALDDRRSLTRRARAYLAAHGVRRDAWTAEQARRHWHRHGVPDAAIEHAAAFQARWGGLELPPTPQYEGGPQVLDADEPGEQEGRGPCFSAGTQRRSMQYGFMVDGAGRFGICEYAKWVPLHGSVAGWVEAAALAHLADGLDAQVRVGTGGRVDGLPERYRLKPFREVEGLADEWWHGPDTLLAIYRGEARLFGNVQYQLAYLYTDIEDLADALRASPA